MDIINYRIQCLKHLNHENLITYLNNHDYALEANILRRTGIDGLEFLEITEEKLNQYKLNSHQKELILTCRDFILGKKIEQTLAKSSNTIIKNDRNSSTLEVPEPCNVVVQKQEENIYMDMNQVKAVLPRKPENEIVKKSKPNKKFSRFYVPKPTKLNYNQLKAIHSDKSIDEKIGSFNKMISVDETDYIATESIAEKKQQNIEKVRNDCYQNLKAVMAEMETVNVEKRQKTAIISESKVNAWQKKNREIQSQEDFSALLNLNQIKNFKLAANEDFSTQYELSDDQKWPIPPSEFLNDIVDAPIKIKYTDTASFPRPPSILNINPEHIKLVKELSRNYKVTQRNCPYYRNTDREGAKELLQRIPNLREGLFLFRNSNEYFLVITIYHQGRFYHSGVHRSDEGTYYNEIYSDQGKILFEFETLQDFVEHFKINPFVMKVNDKKFNIYLKEMTVEEFILTL